MTSTYRQFFEVLVNILQPVIDDLGIKTVNFGGLERLPADAKTITDNLNILLVKPTTIEQEYIDLQKTQRKESAIWQFVFITSWTGDFDDYDNLLAAAELIRDCINENRIGSFKVGKGDNEYLVVVTNQDAWRISSSSDVELYFLANQEIQLACVIVEAKIDSLINKTK